LVQQTVDVQNGARGQASLSALCLLLPSGLQQRRVEPLQLNWLEVVKNDVSHVWLDREPHKFLIALESLRGHIGFRIGFQPLIEVPAERGLRCFDSVAAMQPGEKFSQTHLRVFLGTANRFTMVLLLAGRIETEVDGHLVGTAGTLLD
jgi:hypothetical protein